jgi:hypothetical protein
VAIGLAQAVMLDDGSSHDPRARARQTLAARLIYAWHISKAVRTMRDAPSVV